MKQFERAAGHPIYLLEDAAYRGLRFTPARRAVGARGSRRGGPRDLRRHVHQAVCDRRACRLRHFAGTAFHGRLAHQGQPRFRHGKSVQQLFARALASGAYDKQGARLQKRYAHKARVMKLAIEKDFPSGVEWRGPEGGLYFWARLPQSFGGSEFKSVPVGAEKRCTFCAGRTVLCGQPGAAQTGSRNAHQLRRRERGKHPRRNQAAREGVAEVFGNCPLIVSTSKTKGFGLFVDGLSQFEDHWLSCSLWLQYLIRSPGNWGEMLSPQAGITHAYWTLFSYVLITLILMPAFRKFWAPISQEGDELQKRKMVIVWGYRIGSALFTAFLFTQILIQVASFAQLHPKLKAEIDDKTFNFGDTVASTRTHPVYFQLKIYNAGSPTIVRDLDFMKCVATKQNRFRHNF